ncbi:MAG: hypothetical protein M4579_001803 [Chaenotheca gracillima]|nr:MAG: hypothetical protein M4579_001803 [Chaenotheca gracillima]
MADSGIQIAETIQTASIKRSPSPRHDLNPSTAASKKEPVSIDPNGDGDDVDDDEIPYSVIRPERRKATLPPLPDLRFEQSYLASIAHAETHWRVAFITLRDQYKEPYGRLGYKVGDIGTNPPASMGQQSDHAYEGGGMA